MQVGQVGVVRSAITAKQQQAERERVALQAQIIRLEDAV